MHSPTLTAPGPVTALGEMSGVRSAGSWVVVVVVVGPSLVVVPGVERAAARPDSSDTEVATKIATPAIARTRTSASAPSPMSSPELFFSAAAPERPHTAAGTRRVG